MALTNKQAEGLEIAKKRFLQEKPYTIIAGYAGVGKSYLVNSLVEELNLSEFEVAYACYTGKASLVLQKQGKNATTLHRLLYKSRPNGRGGFTHIPHENLSSTLKLIIVDEISMCPANIWNLLLTHNIHIIGLGDPFQLPPIGGSPNLLEKPHIFLDEIVRQAMGNDIIKYSLALREGEKLKPGIIGKNIRTYNKSELTTDMLLWADQILCGKNATRRQLNQQVRKLLGKKGLADEDDKMICIKNYWQCATPNGEALINGSIGYLKNPAVFDGTKKVTGIFSLSEDEEDNFPRFSLDYTLLETGTPAPSFDTFGRFIKKSDYELDYAYAITTHKSQGSQFDKVLVYDEMLKGEENHNRWLYTAITRAVDKVVVIL